MDRVVALSAVLVGLLSLLGSVLVSTHNGIETQRLAEEIAQLRLTINLQNGQRPVASVPAPTGDVAALPQPIATPSETSQAPSETPEVSEPPASAASITLPQPPSSPELSPSTPPIGAMEPPAPLIPVSPSASSSAPPAVGSTKPADNCIPVGTRFMATKGDSFAICNVPAVVKVGAISESIVNVDGIGTLPAGGLAKIADGKCTLNVFSADATGYAEFKVTCP